MRGMGLAPQPQQDSSSSSKKGRNTEEIVGRTWQQFEFSSSERIYCRNSHNQQAASSSRGSRSACQLQPATTVTNRSCSLSPAQTGRDNSCISNSCSSPSPAEAATHQQQQQLLRVQCQRQKKTETTTMDTRSSKKWNEGLFFSFSPGAVNVFGSDLPATAKVIFFIRSIFKRLVFKW